jgi:hypothetical protein
MHVFSVVSATAASAYKELIVLYKPKRRLPAKFVLNGTQEATIDIQTSLLSVEFRFVFFMQVVATLPTKPCYYWRYLHWHNDSRLYIFMYFIYLC